MQWMYGAAISYTTKKLQDPGGGGVLLGILAGGVPRGSPNLDPISDQKCPFSHPFPEMASKFHAHSQTWPLRNFAIIT